MKISDLMDEKSIILDLKPTTKKQLLEELSSIMAPLTRLDEGAIFDVLLERERLGTTGIGGGVAIPHGKLPSLGRIACFMARLANSVNFESVDDKPVDLVFLLLAPEGAGADHLKALACVSKILRNPKACEELRAAETPAKAFEVLTKYDQGAETKQV